MRYAIARYEKDRKELAYRIYVTDMLQLQGQGKTLQVRFYDTLRPQKTDDRTALEIAHDVLSRAGVEVIP